MKKKVNYMKISLFRKKTINVPTWRGWLVIAVTLCLLMWTVFTRIHNFMAVSSPVTTKVMVLEGWLSDDEVAEAITLFEKEEYELLLVTGLPISKGRFLTKYNNYAELTVSDLIARGFPADKVIAVPTPMVEKDRTFASAREIKRRLTSEGSHVTKLNVVTSGTHARRTRLLYRKALGKAFEIGVIAMKNPYYNHQKWYTSSKGVRTLLGDTIAWFYAVLLFHPNVGNHE